MNNLVIQRTNKGLTTIFNKTNDPKFVRILQDERENRAIFKVDAKFFKVQLKEDIIIYSLIVSVPDVTNDLGYYSINVFSDSHQFIKNYKDILEAIEHLYLATNMRGQDIDSQLSSILSKFLTHSLSNLETSFVNKVSKFLILESNKVDNYQTSLTNIFVFEAVYYIPSEILNSERGVRYMSNTDKFVKENEANQYYRFVTLTSNNNFSDCFLFVDGKRIDSRGINSKTLYFLLNKNTKLQYRFKDDDSNNFETIDSNNFTLPPIPIPQKKYEREKTQTPIFNDELELNLNKFKLISAVLGVLLLVSLIGNGWFVYYKYFKPEKIVEINTNLENVQTDENSADSTSRPALADSSNSQTQVEHLNTEEVERKKKEEAERKKKEEVERKKKEEVERKKKEEAERKKKEEEIKSTKVKKGQTNE